ncbi:MAG TPA: sigma-70 family RNA polymerase sigma factor [Polyangiaceae bacterium]
MPFRRGDRWALERVYRAYARGVDSYLNTLARAADFKELAVSDAIQEVFLRAFSPSARESFEAERPFGPYLRAIARNLFIDALRARDREIHEVAPLLPDAEAPQSDGGAVPDPRVSAVLAAYIGSLPEPIKNVYQQRFVLGHSQETARSALGISRRQLRTAEEKLKGGLRKALMQARILRTDLTQRDPRPTKAAFAAATLEGPDVVR